MDNKGNKMVIQSTPITFAKYNFTADEKRVLTHLIEMMQPLLDGKKLVGKVEQDFWGTYHFELPTNTFFSDGVNRKRIIDAFFSLNDRYMICEDEESVQKVRLIEMPKIKKRGTVEFYLSEPLVKKFLDFNKGYSRYILSVSLSFKSVYSMRIYEFISEQTKPIRFRIKRLKEMWQITEKSYERNFNFIQKIIEPAKRELDKHANWSFDYKPIKKGRSFEYIEFYPIHYPNRENDDITKQELIRKLNLSNFVSREIRYYMTGTCGFSEKELKNNAETIKSFCNKFGDEANDKIRDIWGRARSANDPKAYLIGSLKQEIK